MRTHKLLLFSVSLAVLLAVAACGGDDDDDAGDTPDAGADDGADDDGPDAGDDGGEVDAGADEVLFSDPQGGTVIHEYINYGDTLAEAAGLPDGVRTVYRGMAHFLNAMTPNAMTLPPADVCTNVVTDSTIWVGNLGTGREYIDVGEVQLRGINDDGQEATVTLGRAVDGAPASWPRDNLGLDHGEDGIYYEHIELVAGQFLSAGSLGDLILTGSADYPPTTYEDAVYVPENYELLNPRLNDPFTMTAGQDFTVGWEEVAQPNAPEGYALFELVALVNPATGRPIHLCPSFADEANGEFTIPGEIITDYRETVEALGDNPDQVILLRNTNTHSLVRLENGESDNRRRIDVVSVWCSIQLGATQAE